MPESTPRRSLTADDWITAATAAIGEGGVDAVAVEPLAKRLGATKGSFYWHFKNRQDLLGRTLAAWESEHTDAVIAALEELPEGPGRIGDLLDAALSDIADPLELALLAAAGDPTVGAALARVTERRIAYVTELYRASGMRDDAARSTAVSAVAIYLGHAQLAAAAPGSLPTGTAWTEHVAHLRELFAPR